MKRITSLFLVLVLLVAFVLPVSAADTKSEVYSDLCSATLGGSRFDPRDYPADASDTGVYLLTVNEVGYNSTDVSEYGLYVYLYNPSGVPLNVSSSSNRIQLAVSWDESQIADDWSKFKLEFVSVSHETGHEYVYYKFRVGAEIGGNRTIASYVEPLGRFYDISGFEVQKMSLANATESAVGMRYAYYGSEATRNKTCRASRIDTIELDVHHTYYRTESSANGVNHQNQLNAVYFNVPTEYWVSYDFLYAIKCYWEEYRTTPMIVTDDQDLLGNLTTWRGRGNGSGYNASNPISMYSGKKLYASDSVGYSTYEWTYNVNLDTEGILVDRTYDNCEALVWAFFSDDIVLREADVSSQRVLEYWEKHNTEHRDRMITEEGVNEFFPDRTAGPQTHTILFSDTFDMDSYASNHGWLSRLWHYNIFNGGAGTNLKDDYSGILAIEEVSSAHSKLRAEELAERYFINPADADDFKAVVDEGKKNGMKTVVFRFAVTDYFAEEVNAEINGVKSTGTTYRAEQTVFLNFDVISLTFQKDEAHYVIPVSSSPSDIIGGIDAPQVDKDPSLDNVKDYIDDILPDMSLLTALLRIAGLFTGLFIVFLIMYFVIALLKGLIRPLVKSRKKKGRRKGGRRK